MELVNRRIKILGRTRTPREQKLEAPIDATQASFVAKSRQKVEDILDRKKSRFVVIVGPCSIHDTEAALEYASRLRIVAEKYKDRLALVMRAYFEKPRTSIGWKGLLSEPDRDGSYNIDKGRHLARKFLIELAKMEMPAATEFLDCKTPQFLDDLIAWAAIGARTVESQNHREMAAGLSMPVGFKNGTGGSIDIAINAMITARNPHCLGGMDEDGSECVLEATGNPYGHLILRGGSTGPNFKHTSVRYAQTMLRLNGLPENILIDCSHANASKDYRNQSKVLRAVLSDRREHNTSVMGIMLESNLFAGKQDAYCADPQRGVSITDACIGWEETEDLLAEVYESAV